MSRLRAIAAAAILVALAALAAGPAHAETQKERLERLAKEVFEFEDIESPSSTQNTLLSSFGAAGGFCNARMEAEYERNADGSLGRRFELLDVRIPDAKFRRLFDRVEGTPGAFLIEKIDLTRAQDKGRKDFRGKMTVVAVGFDTEEVANDAQAERIANQIQKFLDRPTWGDALVAALATATAQGVVVEVLRVDEAKKTIEVDVSGAAIAAAQAFATALGLEPAFATFKKPTVKAGPEAKRWVVSAVRKERAAKAKRARREAGQLKRKQEAAKPEGAGPDAVTGTAGPTPTPPPPHGVEPRPRLRRAAEVLDDLARERLWSAEDLEIERPRQEILSLFHPRTSNEGAGGRESGQDLRRPPAETTAMERATLVTATAGPLPLRAWDVPVAIWWEELAPLAERVAQMSRASALLGVELHEVPPPTREQARPKSRVIRLHGSFRVAALGWRPESLGEDDAQATLDAAKRWLERRADLGKPLHAALEALPPHCVVERLMATQERLEVWLAGVRQSEAEQYAARLADLVPVAALFDEPRVERKADTFIVVLDRK